MLGSVTTICLRDPNGTLSGPGAGARGAGAALHRWQVTTPSASFMLLAIDVIIARQRRGAHAVRGRPGQSSG